MQREGVFANPAVAGVLDHLEARVAELENAIICGFKNWSEGGIYAEIVIDADFFETLKHHP